MRFWKFFALTFASMVLSESDSVKPEIASLHILSTIESRFATTLATSQVKNPADKAQEVVFEVQLPNAAFISNFTMEIDGKMIVGDVKEKEKAKEQYNEAKSKGQTAGLVAQAPRDTNQFQISVNVAPKSKAIFNLTYQELLQRVHGVYKHVININPGQIVGDLKIDVYIEENAEIVNLTVPEIEKKAGELTNKNLLQKKQAKNVAIDLKLAADHSNVHISYAPSSEDQKKFSDVGLVGQMVVLYDVKRDNSAGEIEVVNGYFVHFFAPEGLSVGDKSVVFILDRSGSMEGLKIQQLKDAMKTILKDMKSGDQFNIVTFSTDVTTWKRDFVPATTDNVVDASVFSDKIDASGSTNIYQAMETGLRLLKNNKSGGKKLAEMIVFLTDGLPTVNVTDFDEIIKSVNKWNSDTGISIHCIAFGSDADYDSLKKISTQNGGLARKVYDELDAALQLEGFYDEISSPLLTKTKINYLDDTVDQNSIVQDSTHNLYNKGGEIVVAGRVNDGLIKDGSPSKVTLKGTVEGQSEAGSKVFEIARPIDCWEICPIILYDVPIGRADIIVSNRRWNPCHRPCPIPPPRTTPRPTPEEPANTRGGQIERAWAYLTIKKLLDKAKYDAVSSSEAQKLKDEALQLSLKYNFVTELTSMVVTKPDQEKGEVTDVSKVEREHEAGQLAPNGAPAPAPAPAPLQPNKGFQGRPIGSVSSFGLGNAGAAATNKKFGGFGGGGSGSAKPVSAPFPSIPARPPPPPPADITPSETKLTDEEKKPGTDDGNDKDSNIQGSSTCTYRSNVLNISEPFVAFENTTANSRDECARKCHDSSQTCNAVRFNPKLTSMNCELANLDQSKWGCSVDNTNVGDDDDVVILFCIKC